MLDSTIQTDLLREVEQLPPPLQRKVVDFAHALAQSMPRGTPASELQEFARILDTDEAEMMIAAVECDCERVDSNEW